MGREIRRVPANWQHPDRDPDYNEHGRKGLQPMYDKSFDDAFAEWLADFDRIRAGKLEGYEVECYPNGLADWLEDSHAPCRAYYRPWKDEEATWFQLWETVSEGTPVSPPFATKQELADHLAKHGDSWDQSRCQDPHTCRLFGLTPGKPGWGKQKAESFVFGGGWAPSMVVENGRVMDGVTAVTQPTTE